MIVSLSKIKSYYHFDVRTIIIMNKIKDGKIDLIVKEAVPLFLEKSISDISMNEIAKFVGVGEASLYRYFQKKQNLVIQISAKLADEVFNHYFSFEQKLSGYEQISDFFKAYGKVFKEHPEYFKFINELDAYILNENVQEKKEYEDMVVRFKNIFDRAYEKGLADGSVKKIKNCNTFYYASAHSLLNLCKFLASSDVLSEDSLRDKNGEIQIMTKIILNYVKD